MWEEGRTTVWRSMHKTVDHPDLGPLVLDCDTLLLPDTVQSLIVYSAAAAGTREASALDMLHVTHRTVDRESLLFCAGGGPA